MRSHLVEGRSQGLLSTHLFLGYEPSWLLMSIHLFITGYFELSVGSWSQQISSGPLIISLICLRLVLSCSSVSTWFTKAMQQWPTSEVLSTDKPENTQKKPWKTWLSYLGLQTDNLACYNVLDTEKWHAILGSETKLLLPTTHPASWTACACQFRCSLES